MPSPLVRDLLSRRGIVGNDEVQKFLIHDRAHLSDPFLLPGIHAACGRVLAAIERRESVFIYGDGDADGVCATAILLCLFRAAGCSCGRYLTHRLEEYEIAPSFVGNLAQEGVRLFITVDCGSSSHAALERAVRDGLDVIVLDHHICDVASLPAGPIYAIPSLAGPDTAFSHLCGAGLSFMLARGMAAFLPGAAHGRMTGTVELAALGTVADSVALRGDNRLIVVEGLQAMAGSGIPGIRMLMERLGIRSVSCRDVTMRIAPKLNTPGRFGTPEVALDLLLSETESEAFKLLREIERLDRRRYALCRAVMKESSPAVVSSRGFLLVDGLLPSLCGIIASRLADEHRIPVMVCSRSGDEIQGSARTPASFDLFRALEPVRELCESFGGHAGAVGFQCRTAVIERMRSHWEEEVCRRFGEVVRRPRCDATIALETILPPFLKELSFLEPYGAGNPEPSFLIESVTVQTIIHREGDVTRFWVRRDGTPYECIVATERADMVEPGRTVDVICTPRSRESGGLYRIILSVHHVEAVDSAGG